MQINRYLPNVSAANPGKKINFVEAQAAAGEYADQLAPFQVLGTIGRVPLIAWYPAVKA